MSTASDPLMCGNGTVDQCGTRAIEQCDGKNLGGNTCQSLGYASGVASCDSVCQLDGRKCESCIPNSRTVSCVHPFGGVPPAKVGLAATATEIGVAWTEQGQHGAMLHFTRMSPDFTVLSDVGCIAEVFANWPLTVAVTPSGWVVATATGTGATVVSIDTLGAVRATHTFPGVTPRLQLIERRTGGPLLTWGEQPTTMEFTAVPFHMLLLNEDGSQLGADITFPDLEFTWAGAFVDDGFELAVNLIKGYQVHSLQLLHLDLQGALRSDASISTTFVEAAAMASSGTDLRLVYRSDNRTMFQRVSRAGALIGGPINIDMSSGPWVYPIFAVGDDTVVLQVPRRPRDGDDMSLFRLAADGTSRWPATPIVRSKSEFYGMAEQGGDAIVAWVDPSPYGFSYSGTPNPADPLVQSALGIQRVKVGL